MEKRKKRRKMKNDKSKNVEAISRGMVGKPSEEEDNWPKT